MNSDYELKRQAVYPPDPVYANGYPNNPPGYPPNQSGPPVYTPNQVPIYSNVPPPYYGQQQAGVIVTTQPNPNVMVLPQPTSKDYFAWSIVNLIFCNLILGIVAVVFSSKAFSILIGTKMSQEISMQLKSTKLGQDQHVVKFFTQTRDAVRRRDSISAASYSQVALALNITALVLGIIGHIVWISWVIYWSVTYGTSASSYYNYGYYG